VQPSAEGKKGSRFYFNFTGFPFPLGPFFERRTVRNEVGACEVVQFYAPAAVWLLTVAVQRMHQQPQS
jgi:hypothetical protein